MVLLSVTVSGARFHILTASLVDVFLTDLDSPILIGRPFLEALVVAPTSCAVCCFILSG